MRTSIPASILDAIGGTKMISMGRYLDSSQVTLSAKLEGFNPGGSAKDRPARRMIERGFDKGFIDAETTVIESSSGNMGIGLAQVCAFYNLKFICVVDPNAQPQNIAIIRALGGVIKLVSEPLNGDFLSARLGVVSELCRNTPNSFWPNQYANPCNPEAHAEETIVEIVDELGDAPDYLFVATSSTGTIQGCNNYLKKQKLHTKVIAVDAVGSVLFNGTAGPRKISGIGAGVIPSLAVGKKFDGLIRIGDVRAIYGCRRAAAKEAVLIGGSGGAVLEAVRLVEDQLAGCSVAAIIHDSGARYMETVFNDSWVETTFAMEANSLSDFENINYSRNYKEEQDFHV